MGIGEVQKTSFGEYQQIGRFLNEIERISFTRLIHYGNNPKFDWLDELPDGRLNHIVKKGTKNPVAYIGADNQIELVDPKNSDLRKDHNRIIAIYRSATRDKSVGLRKPNDYF